MTVTILQLQQNGNPPGPGFISGKELKHFVPLILFHKTRGRNHERVLQNVKMQELSILKKALFIRRYVNRVKDRRRLMISG